MPLSKEKKKRKIGTFHENWPSILTCVSIRDRHFPNTDVGQHRRDKFPKGQREYHGVEVSPWDGPALRHFQQLGDGSQAYGRCHQMCHGHCHRVGKVRKDNLAQNVITGT